MSDNTKNNRQEIGALWSRIDKNGSPYFTGNLKIKGETIMIVAFKNRHKTEDKYPDYHILVSVPREEKPAIKDEAEIGV